MTGLIRCAPASGKPRAGALLPMIINDLPRPPITPPNTIKLVIPAPVVLGLVKDVMPIDAAIINAGYDAATDRIELTIYSDFWKQPDGQ